MAFVLVIFDLLAYAIPGSLYLTTFAYVSHRAGWIDVPSLIGLPSLVLLIAVAVAAFLTGQAAHPLGRGDDRVPGPRGVRRGDPLLSSLRSKDDS